MQVRNVLVVYNIFYQIPGSIHLENNPMYCYTLSDVDQIQLVGVECIVNIQILYQLLIKENDYTYQFNFIKWLSFLWTFSYDRIIVCQQVIRLVLVLMYDNISLYHPDNKHAANNRDQCCRFLTPKMFHPMVLWGIFVELNPILLYNKNKREKELGISFTIHSYIY